MIVFYTKDARPDLPKLRGVTVDPALGVGDWVRYQDDHHRYLARHGSIIKVAIRDRQWITIYAWLIPGENPELKPIE
jgi:hypothetical protein